ncbi:hypothetical protein MRX96_011557 [Rhipicephalus microplus]
MKSHGSASRSDTSMKSKRQPAPCAATAAAAPDATSGTCNASTTSTHSGQGTSRASRPSAASVALSKKLQVSGAAVHSSVLEFLFCDAFAVLVVGTFIMFIILYKYSTLEGFDGTMLEVEQYCPHEATPNYGAALDSEALHDWFTYFKRSLGEGSAHLQAGTRARSPCTVLVCGIAPPPRKPERRKRLLRELMSKMRIPWPDDPSANVGSDWVCSSICPTGTYAVCLTETKGIGNT